MSWGPHPERSSETSGDWRSGAMETGHKIVGEMGYDVVNFRVEAIGKKRGDTECGCIQINVY